MIKHYVLVYAHFNNNIILIQKSKERTEYDFRRELKRRGRSKKEELREKEKKRMSRPSVCLFGTSPSRQCELNN